MSEQSLHVWTLHRLYYGKRRQFPLSHRRGEGTSAISLIYETPGHKLGLSGNPYPVMKKLLSILVPLLVIVSFVAGWRGGQQSTLKLTSNIINRYTFDSSFSQIAENYLILSQLDSGRIEDAKQLVHRNITSEIFTLDDAIESSGITTSLMDLKNLDALQKENHQKPLRQIADGFLAHVAQQRNAHPWTETNSFLTAEQNAQFTARLDAILKRAIDSQRSISASTNFSR